MKYIIGNQVASPILREIKKEVIKLPKKPLLAIVLASEDGSCKKYVSLKAQKAESIGIKVKLFDYGKSTDRDEIISQINRLNKNRKVDGILIQLPLFKHLSQSRYEILNSIAPEKDVDGLTAVQQGYSGQLLPHAIFPATVQAILECINYTYPAARKIEWKKYKNRNNYLKGKNILIINNSTLIGRPLSSILSAHNATVTIANKFTAGLKAHAQNADILISATGKAQVIDHTYVKKNSTVIDVTSILVEGKAQGDMIISPKLQDKAKWLTPVPGGVGPITVVCLLRNLIHLCARKAKRT